jgi:Tfp pilus assembly protein PilV
MKKDLQNKIKKSGGFTVLETLIAISIILIAITGPLVVISQSLKASLHAKDEITAFYLAQEAIEYARLIRDNNVVSGGAVSSDWLVSATPLDMTTNVMGAGSECENNAGAINNKCYLSNNSDGSYTFAKCPAGICPNLKLDDNGLYNTTNPDDTIFKREIYFNKVPSADAGCATDGCDNREIQMTVVIKWTNIGGSESQYSINERLFNWKATD